MNTEALFSRLHTPDFLVAALRPITWRPVLLTQLLGAVFALTPWLEQWGQRTQPSLPLNLAQQASAAVFLMLAAFAGDEAVRRGWRVLRAFVVVLLCASGATALTQWGINHWFSLGRSGQDSGSILTSFVAVGGYWGTALMVYLNRQSAARLLASVRGGELDRVQAERRLIASGLAAVEARVDPAAVSRQLGQVRDLYAADSPDAEPELEALISNLRGKVAQCARVP